jgi:hypothetical protein
LPGHHKEVQTDHPDERMSFANAVLVRPGQYNSLEELMGLMEDFSLGACGTDTGLARMMSEKGAGLFVILLATTVGMQSWGSGC